MIMTKENAGEIIRGGVGKFAKTDKGYKRIPISDKHKIELVAYLLNIKASLFKKYLKFVESEWLNSTKTREFIDECAPRRKTKVPY